MEQKLQTSYKEVKIGKTLYRVTSIFNGEKDLKKSIENLAVHGAINEMRAIQNCSTIPIVSHKS